MASTQQKIRAAVSQMMPRIMIAVMQQRTPKARAQALKYILQGVDPVLSNRVAQATVALEQKGVAPALAVRQAISNELALHLHDLVMGMDSAVESLGGWGGIFDEGIPGNGLGTATVGGSAYTPGSIASSLTSWLSPSSGQSSTQAAASRLSSFAQSGSATGPAQQVQSTNQSRSDATNSIIDTVFGQINQLAQTVGNITVSGMQVRRGQTVTGLPTVPEGGAVIVDEEGVTVGPGGISGAAPWGVIFGAGIAIVGVGGILYWASQRKKEREKKQRVQP